MILAEELKFIKELQDVQVEELGQSLTLECELNKEGVKIDWYKDKKRITPADLNRKIIVSGQTHRLVIEKVSLEDLGTYTAEFKDLVTTGKVLHEGIALRQHATRRGLRSFRWM